jgi:Tol biopolymer transport system component
MDIQGIGTPRPIIAAKPAGAACWSPDGNRIACAVNFADTVSPDVYVVNRDGSDAIVLTSDHSSCPVEWSPDGARILFMRWNGAKYVSLHLMDADGSHSVRLADMSPVEIYSAHFSPDGARIAFEAFRPEGFPMDIYVMNRDGSDLSKILENTFSDFDWMPMN